MLNGSPDTEGVPAGTVFRGDWIRAPHDRVSNLPPPAHVPREMVRVSQRGTGNRCHSASIWRAGSQRLNHGGCGSRYMTFCRRTTDGKTRGVLRCVAADGSRSRLLPASPSPPRHREGYAKSDNRCSQSPRRHGYRRASLILRPSHGSQGTTRSEQSRLQESADVLRHAGPSLNGHHPVHGTPRTAIVRGRKDFENLKAPHDRCERAPATRRHRGRPDRCPHPCHCIRRCCPMAPPGHRQRLNQRQRHKAECELRSSPEERIHAC